ncbi:NAD(P)/FAD-dependent oxidoreductase [Pseudobacteroides cellulosolvens]|uniref:Pyridine nucleotide-disulfide oxidoreductase, FAD/NAD(P)-binding domain containing protein n=1 Tax=Pseudobacteroides cellulosolvens ATCC 35603 = DSM 2933 TaxID=398512 RepID=A0A0L6JT67_9FIRM|nr:FAD-dependent oxidoreductase [Pseudobacteroides cellulosolvens]KNY28894.1 Pyridine nucleotide-disulfide oxidoreductase, FAD/NAD(P)-binding domain containing protein [Pseudobacteroides cellulosolvens ATCC 35603 = DSM 2933]
MVIMKDVVIIGAGPAGLAAAVELFKNGIKDIVVLEREPFAGGILNQCIHDGFGVIKFNEVLTGPEYAHRYIDEAEKLGIEILTSHTVIAMSREKEITVLSSKGLITYKAKAVILAMGCRERTRGAIGIPGTRPAGIFTAGVAQNLVNLKNMMIGNKVVILGSGDIGLIMARRLTLEGVEVIAVVEKMPYSNGLARNITQCLEDYDIPLLLSHTVINIEGRERLKSVTIARVDEKGEPIEGTSQKFTCDTLILSVGLIPENELTLGAGIELDDITQGAIVDENLQTSIKGVFACGNVLQVHDLVDHVSNEAEKAARSVKCYLEGLENKCIWHEKIEIKAGMGVRYVIPHTISGNNDVTFSMRVDRQWENKKLSFKSNGKKIKSIRHRRLNPSEMVVVTIKASELQGIKGLEVSVDEE